MFVLKSAVLLLILGINPFFLGKILTYGEQKKCEMRGYMLGFFLMLAIFQVMCVPMTYMHISFRVLVWCYSIVLLILGGTAIGLNRKNLHMRLFMCMRLSRYEVIYLTAFIVLLIIQMYFFVFYEISYMSWDDYNYVVNSTSAIYDNGMYVTNVVTGGAEPLTAKRALTSYMIFIAYLSEVSGFKTTTLSHTILPIYLLVVAYVGYYLIAKYLFKNRDDRLIFMTLLSVVNIFGLYSHYSMTFRLLAAIWNGKSVVMIIGIPFLLVLLPELFRDRITKRKMVYLFVVTMGICSLSMMGAGMSMIVIIVISAIYFFRGRENKYICYACGGCFVPIVHMMLYFVLR